MIGGAAETLRIIYAVDVADHGTKKLLASERAVQKSLKQTTASFASQDAQARRSAMSSTQSSTRKAAGFSRERTAAVGLSGALRTVGTQERVLTSLGPGAAAAQARLTAQHDRQTASLKRLTVAEKAQTAARRTAASQPANRAADRVPRGARPGVVAATGGAAGAVVSNSRLAAGFGGALAVKQAIDFDRALRNVNSIAGLTEKQLQAVGVQLRGLGGKTAQAPVTLAKGMYDLVSSGFDAKDSLHIVEKAANAATAGLTTTDVSAGAVAGALNAYKLPARSAGAVSDTLFKIVDRGVISFEQLAQNIGPVQGMASSLKIPLDQVGASIATLTKQGIPVPETMTYIRASMSSLLKPSEDMSVAFKKLGVDGVEGLLKKFGGFQGAMEAVAGTTDGTKASLSRLFPNVRALGGAMGLTGDKAKGARRDLKDLGDSSGATNKALAEQSKSTAYQWEQTKASAQALAITVGNNLLPPLNSTLKAFTGLPGPVKIALAAMAGGALVIGPINRLRKNVFELGGSIRAAARTAAKSRIASRLAEGASGAGAMMRRALGSVKGVISSLMTRAGRSGGAAAAESIASSTGGGVGAQMTSRSGKFRAAGRASGRVFGRAMGIAAATAIAVAVGNALVSLTDKIGLLGGAAGRKSRGNWVDKNIPGMGALRDLGRRAGLEKRRGGIVGRYSAGGLVPIVASGGEMMVHNGAASMIGGPSDRDGTPMLAPAGAAILTGSGQAMMAGGASLNEAIAGQLPHFMSGGRVAAHMRKAGFKGRGLLTGLAVSKGESGWNERAVNRNSNGSVDRGLFQINSIHGAKSTFDPQGNTNAAWSISSRASNWNPWVVFKKGLHRKHMAAAKAAAAGGGGTSGGGERSAGLLGRSRFRSGLIADAFSQGQQAGLEGLTRGDIRREGSPMLRAIREATATRSSATSGRARNAATPGAPSGRIAAGGGWGGSENIIRTAIKGLGSASFKRAANHPLSRKNPSSDHNMANKGAFAADLPPGDGIFNRLRQRLNIPARKGSWNTFANRPVKGYRSQLLWHAPDGSHTDHVHVGVRRMRRGGRVGATGSSPVGRALSGGLRNALSMAGGSLEALDKTIGRSLQDKLDTLRAQLERRVRKGGPRKTIERLQSVISLIDFEIGRRIGRIQDVVAQRTASIDRSRGVVDRALRKRGVSADSVQGIAAMQALQGRETMVRQQNVTSLQSALRRARGYRRGGTVRRFNSVGGGARRSRGRKPAGHVNKAAVREITEQLQDAIAELDESIARQIELRRDAIRAAGQEKVNAAQFRLGWVQTEGAGLEARQRLSRTQDTAGGMRQRADWIQKGVIPELQATIQAQQTNAQMLASIGDLDGWRAAILEAQSAAVDLANAQADAADLIREAGARVVQDRVDVATHGATMADLRLVRLELEQRRDGTFGSTGGAQARADFIRQQIVPALDAEIIALTAQQMEAQRQGNTDLVRQLTEGILGKTNDILQKNLDANEQTAENTDALKEFGGSVAYSYRGEPQLDVIGSRIGA